MAKKLSPERPSDELMAAARASLAREGGDLSTLTPAQWLHVAGVLAEEGDVEGLARLGEGVEDKKFQKALRGLWHKLKSRGLSVPERRREGVSLARESTLESVGAASLAAVSGEMIAVLGFFADLAWVVEVRFGLEDDVIGVAPTDRAHARGVLKGHASSELGRAMLTDVPADYRLYLLGEAVRRARRSGQPFDPALTELLTRLGRLPDRDPHPLIGWMEREGLEPARALSTSGDLHEDRAFFPVRPGERWIKAFIERYDALGESKIIVSPERRLERERDLIGELASEMVESIGVEAAAFAMRHDGYMAALAGRHKEAAAFARTADVLEDGSVEPKFIPLLTYPFERFMTVIKQRDAMEEAEAPETEVPQRGSLIIKP